MTNTIRVALADDQDLVRTGLRMILSAEADLEVVGEAVDGVDAVAIARELAPDVLLMDIRMPQLDGIDATRRITRTAPATRVVMLTTGRSWSTTPWSPGPAGSCSRTCRASSWSAGCGRPRAARNCWRPRSLGG